ncbi:pyruvate dehydrogenase (acetyl-transferring) E1 component subunit alpha [Roseivivax sp. GX 12232]|uniref:thiamine pyrophosphate-dependent enzyme n=1 Tax=Roseivivax sp. GX 12232 TaxID=2900547 RepID=UPI001E36AED9|nr:thiamine pyrophosphate-dependent enzyme [Roseivivax sp. GX 12232]MCE0504354.1 pyruvate dehydrogenase (acetyl-transferring) E1 component subunit alpha [Roseivivax sp. GX 12232]
MVADGSSDREDALTDYRRMLLIRRFEEKAGQLFGMGLIEGYCHLCIGQEAVVAGLERALRPGDRRVASYRAHGHMLAAGMEPGRIMAELLGRAAGYSRGHGGSMHMFSPDDGFYGGHGMLAAQVPIGAGLAFAERYRRSNNITVASYGDVAANLGPVAETYHLAALWALPLLFVIENNQDGAARRGPGLSDRAAAHGIPVARVDGMDVTRVAEAAETAALHVRAGKGPYLIEAQTYRYRGHSMADPAKYRTLDEMQKVRAERDPIARERARLVTEGLSEKTLKEVDAEVKEVVTAAAEFARASAPARPEGIAPALSAEVPR